MNEDRFLPLALVIAVIAFMIMFVYAGTFTTSQHTETWLANRFCEDTLSQKSVKLNGVWFCTNEAGEITPTILFQRDGHEDE